MLLIMQGVIPHLVDASYHAAGVIRFVRENLANLESALPEMSNIGAHKSLPIPQEQT